MLNQPARTRLALVAALVALLAGRAEADVAARGTFDISLNVGIPNTSFNGMLFFDTGTQTVLGTSVDLASDVGDMSYAGTAQVNLQSRSATFEFTAGPTNGFAFHAQGAGACDATGCLNGQATFGGIFDSVTDPMGVVPDATYTFDGSIFVSFLGGGVGGTFGINAFDPQPTATGTNVEVGSGPTTFFDSTQGIVRSFEATIRYPNVTAGGTTSFVAFSEVPGEIPAGYQLAPALSIFIDIFTSATFTGNADVCVTVADVNGDGLEDNTNFPVAQLRMLHAAASGQDFTDVTNATSPDGFLCGNVSSLSPFVLGIDPSLGGSTTTTTTPGGGTTTTTLPGAGCTDPVVCIDAALGAPLCGEETINAKLDTLIDAKLGKAKTLITQAATKPAAKVEKLLKKARKQLTKVGVKADAFVSKKKGPITSACRDSIRATLAQIEAALTDNPPTGTGGIVTGGVRATIDGREPFDGDGYYVSSLYVQGCEPFRQSDVCDRAVVLSVFSEDPAGPAQTLEQSPTSFPFLAYSESTSRRAPQDLVWLSAAGMTVEILGLTEGRVQGSFSGTLEPQPPAEGLLAIDGTFDVPEQS